LATRSWRPKANGIAVARRLESDGEEEMTNQDDETGRRTPPGTFSAAAGHAQQAMDRAKEVLTGTDFEKLRTKAADAASAAYHEGRELLTSSEERARARDQLSESIRKNPLAAVGVAFTAGVLLALLMRG
jgi:ElaB/YqjD/DUF883 family membrane-anchored ribosome-binding protein